MVLVCLYPYPGDKIYLDMQHLSAVRAFALRIERHFADYGQRHHLHVEPLLRQSLELGNRVEIGDIFLSRGDEKGLQSGELLLERRLVAARDNVDVLWQKILRFIHEQELLAFRSPVLSEAGGRKIVSVGNIGYFFAFMQMNGENLTACAPSVNFYYTGMENVYSLPVVFKQ